ncbi:MAG TPA: MXAN_2562 family outer membrane beta-barrel protein [Myxococcales bacterium]|nr:MXAN_2562 family outer membrane beta-barrel protein [Myxococcales bacterium]
MRIALFAILLGTPFAASAQVSIALQSSDSTSSNGTSPLIFVGAAKCGTEDLHFNWTLTGLTGAETVSIIKARSSGTCNTATSSITSPDLTSTTSDTETGADVVPAREMILDSDAGMPGGCSNTTISSASPYTTFYCIQVASSTLVTGTQISSGFVQVNFATAPPTPPINVTGAEGDQHLKINWEAGNTSENILTYDVHVVAGADASVDPTAKPSTQVTAQTNADVTVTDDGTRLQNDQPYTVQVVANDAYGNVSAPSASATCNNGADAGTTCTPVNVLDFYNLYRTEGGGAEGHGGCSSSGTTWVVVIGLLAALLARRKRAGAALLLLLALLVPAAARADDAPPRRVLVGFKVDRYDPKVDSEAALNGAQPYKEIFGTRAPLRYQLEVDWEVWHPFGTFLVGATAGFWQNYGKGLVAETRQPSGDTALLDIMPLGAIVTYRFDWLADRWPRFPVIPYAQIGLMRALWTSFSGTGSVSKDKTGGGRGSGWTYGYTTALGVAVSLNAIDPELAREAYADTGIQRSAIFAEYGWTQLDDFGSSNTLILSDHAWRFGLSVEF